MLTSIDVKFIFDSARLGLLSFPNILQISRCRPLSCVLAVLAIVLTLETSEMSVISKQLNPVPRSSPLTVH